MKKFFDTSTLLTSYSDLSDVIISSKTIEELEHIKTSSRKSDAIKFDARQAVYAINQFKPEVIVVTNVDFKTVESLGLEITNDNLIIAAAARYALDNEIEFYTQDYLCGLIASTYFNLNVCRVDETCNDTYKGYKIVYPDDDILAEIYNKDNFTNFFDCNINEYIVIKDTDDNIQDILKWTEHGYSALNNKNIKSLAFGDKLKPKDEYQRMAVDSLLTNPITAISGHAGSGKSLLCLMAAMHLIESGKYDRLVILFNPCPARGSSQLGFYSGSVIEKAMQSNIGHILVSKIGERFAVDNMISSGKIKLIPMADCRGTEIRDNEILWITEGENTTVDLMKLCLSRVSSGAKVFVEGDYDQIDSRLFENKNNGLKRAIEVLKNNQEFGFVELQNVWRSRIAELVDEM